MDKPVGNLWAEARAGALSAPSEPPARRATKRWLHALRGERPRRPGKRRGLGRGGRDAGAEHTSLQTDSRWPAPAPAGPQEPRAPLPLPPTPASVPLPKVQNIYKVCSARQVWVPRARGRACPASALGSVHPAQAAGLGVQGRAESECSSARLLSGCRNPRPSATVLGIDGSISAF